MKIKVPIRVTGLLLVILGLAIGCGKPNDNELTGDVQGKLKADSGLSEKQIVVVTAGGVVTLSGTVDNNAQRDAAAGYASSVKGVKQVVNNLQIGGATGTAQMPAQPGGAGPGAPGGAQRAPIPPGTPTPDVINKQLAVSVYAANNQSPDQQQYDEMSCYDWAKSQTSIDPMGSPTPVEQVQKGPNEAKGSRASGAARGAAKGAVIGSISGNAGRGAAVGATVGTVRGGQKVRQGEAQAEQDYQQAQAQAQQQAAANDKQRISTFKKSFSACVQGRGYTIQ